MRRDKDDDRPCGWRWDRETGMEAPLFPEPQPQPRDPLAAACAAYCRLRNADMPERDRCPGAGDCWGCRETVSAIVRAYNADLFKD